MCSEIVRQNRLAQQEELLLDIHQSQAFNKEAWIKKVEKDIKRTANCNCGSN